MSSPEDGAAFRLIIGWLELVFGASAVLRGASRTAAAAGTPP